MAWMIRVLSLSHTHAIVFATGFADGLIAIALSSLPYPEKAMNQWEDSDFFAAEEGNDARRGGKSLELAELFLLSAPISHNSFFLRLQSWNSDLMIVLAAPQTRCKFFYCRLVSLDVRKLWHSWTVR